MAPEISIPRHLWLRAESKANERRTPLTPSGSQALIDSGFRVTVEKMPDRIFPDSDYESEGCELTTAGAWRSISTEAIILGLKELPLDPDSIEQTHIYFAHAFKGQENAQHTLERFRSGGGRLLDLEYLTEENGRRVAAFGHWAGYVGAGVALQAFATQELQRELAPLEPHRNRTQLDQVLARETKALMPQLNRKLRALIIGAHGRSGKGATECLRRAGVDCTLWDIEQTQRGGPFSEILDYDLLINCVLLNQPTAPFVTPELLHELNRPLMICDVSCDPTHPFNPLPVYTDLTTYATPVQPIRSTQASIISIDNLPTLLPLESSVDFAEQLLGHLLALPEWTEPWQNTDQAFQNALKEAHL